MARAKRETKTEEPIVIPLGVALAGDEIIATNPQSRFAGVPYLVERVLISARRIMIKRAAGKQTDNFETHQVSEFDFNAARFILKSEVKK
jgi:hypothetical protein